MKIMAAFCVHFFQHSLHSVIWGFGSLKALQLFFLQLFCRDFHMDDRDGLTDMTLLQYACKAGSCGFADVNSALKLARQLLKAGADPGMICCWTGMNALHYAAFFNAPPMIDLLLEEYQGTVC